MSEPIILNGGGYGQPVPEEPKLTLDELHEQVTALAKVLLTVSQRLVAAEEAVNAIITVMTEEPPSVPFDETLDVEGLIASLPAEPDAE